MAAGCALCAQLEGEIQDLNDKLHAAEVERDCALHTLHAEQELRDRAEARLP